MSEILIYALCDPESGEVRYIGKTTNLPERLRSHLQDGSATHKVHWIRKLRSFGVIPVIELIEAVSVDDWPDAERFWIAYFRFMGARLCNLDSGGMGGRTACAETRRRMSDSARGKILSAETREKLRIISTGRRHSDEARRKISAGNSGKVRSPECVEQMRISRQGKPAIPKVLAMLRTIGIGRIKSEEERRKLSEANKGRKRPDLVNRNKSLEMRSKISAALKGRPKSEEHKQKQREAMLRRFHG